ncbi:MAG: leucine-rich repeat domain-containing protein [Bacillota bacterium]|jgi:Leucine-rich repeat (LRR) protein
MQKRRLIRGTFVLILLLFIIVGCGRNTFAGDNNKIFNFEDPRFEHMVRQSCEIGNKPITQEVLNKITELDYTGLSPAATPPGEKRLKSIKGISALKNLSYLRLSNWEISDISELAKLPKLKTVWLDRNEIEDISAFECLKELESVNLSRNRIKDISPLVGKTKLSKLYLSNNMIKQVPSLEESVNLQSLDLGNNPINDVSQLQNFNNLKDIRLHNTQLKDITFLKDAKQLRNVDISCNWISDISPLTEKPLYSLDLSSNQIRKLPNLNVDHLNYMYSRNNMISDINELIFFRNSGPYGVFDISYNQIPIVNEPQLAEIQSQLPPRKSNPFSLRLNTPQVVSKDCPMPWSESAIQNLKSKKLIPDEQILIDLRRPITESEFAVMLEKLAQYTKKSFNLNVYYPHGTLSRYNASVSVGKLVEIANGENAKELMLSKNPFFDLDMSNYTPEWSFDEYWYAGYLEKKGIMRGVNSTRFDPDGELTREMAIVIVNRLLDMFS